MEKVLPIVFTPMAPRGEKALNSLTWSLQALNANIPTSLLIHHGELELENNKIKSNSELFIMLNEALQILG